MFGIFNNGLLQSTGKEFYSVDGVKSIEFNATETELNDLYLGAKLVDGKIVKGEEYDISMKNIEKIEKRELINNIATLSDQLNALAYSIEVLAEGNDDPRLDNAREMFNNIKKVLAK